MVESYICYPPTSYPFHVIFETVEKDSSLKAEKAYHLETVIANLRLFPEYYHKVTLTYSLAEQGPLLLKFTANNHSGNGQWFNFVHLCNFSELCDNLYNFFYIKINGMFVNPNFTKLLLLLFFFSFCSNCNSTCNASFKNQFILMIY